MLDNITSSIKKTCLDNSKNINNLIYIIDFLQNLNSELKLNYSHRINNKYYNYSINNLDYLCIYNIIKFLNSDFISIINFAYTSKNFYNELYHFILFSNSIIINNFNKYNTLGFKFSIENSFYTINHLKLLCDNIFNYSIPVPSDHSLINYKSINCTIKLFENIFSKYKITGNIYAISDSVDNNNNILFNFYYNLFKLKYQDDKELYGNNVELYTLFKLFDYSSINYIYYDYKKNNVIDTYLPSKNQYSNNFNLYLNIYKSDNSIRIFKCNFDLFSIFYSIKIKKYQLLIDILNTFEFKKITKKRKLNYDRIKLINNIIYSILNKSVYYSNILSRVLILIALKSLNFILSDNKNKFIVFNNITIPILNNIYYDVNNYFNNFNQIRPNYLNKYLFDQYFDNLIIFNKYIRF
jgi:hypothetical protein